MIIGKFDIKNPLEVIQCIIAFDSRDWFANKRDRMLYAIVFGISEDCKDCYENVGYSEEEIKEYNELHEKYELLMENHYPKTQVTGFERREE